MAIRLARDAKLVYFSSSDGVKIEGRLTQRDRGRAVVLCHPHPLHGGSMLTPVIMTAEQAFQESGCTTLVFNFRGVGASQGSYGEGRDEVADVSGALSYLEKTLGGPPGLQVVAGYSFGSMVGATVAAADSRVQVYLGIAPPLNGYDFSFLRTAKCRVALIGALHDQFCDGERLEALRAALPAPAWVRVLDTDHFFTEALDDLAQACRDAAAWARESKSD